MKIEFQNSKSGLCLRGVLAIVLLLASSCTVFVKDRFDPYEGLAGEKIDGSGDLRVGPLNEIGEETSQSVVMERMKFYEIEVDREPIEESDLKPSSKTYRVGAGDELDIEMADDPSTRASTFVMPDGMLYYSAANGVRAEGLTVSELERELEKALADFVTAPQVNVSPRIVKSVSYSIVGQIAEPGIYPLSQPTNLLDALSNAGGIYGSSFGGSSTELADLKRSILVRNGKIVPVDFEALVERGEMRNNVYLMSGDYIYLPATGGEKVYVLGAVKQPTGVGYSSNLTLVSALASAGGPKKESHVFEILLIRNSMKDPKVGIVNLRNVLRGGQSNFHLEPGDIIWVPHGPYKKLKEYAREILDAAATTIAVQETSKALGRD